MICNSINNFIIFESLFVLNNFKQIIIFDNIARLNINFYNPSFHINICIDKVFLILNYVLQFINTINISSILVNNDLLIKYLKVLINSIKNWSTICYKHMSFVISETPSILLPSLHFLSFKSFSIQSINFSLSPC